MNWKYWWNLFFILSLKSHILPFCVHWMCFTDDRLISWDASGHWPETLGESILSRLFFFDYKTILQSFTVVIFFFCWLSIFTSQFQASIFSACLRVSWLRWCEARGCYATVNKIMSRTHYCLCPVGLLCEVRCISLRAAGFSVEGRDWRESRNHVSIISSLQRVP